MKLNAKQIEVIKLIESLLGVKLNASSIKRKVIKVDLPDSNSCFNSSFYDKVSNICQNYGVGRVASGGFGALAIIIN